MEAGEFVVGEIVDAATPEHGLVDATMRSCASCTEITCIATTSISRTTQIAVKIPVHKRALALLEQNKQADRSEGRIPAGGHMDRDTEEGHHCCAAGLQI